MKPYVAQVAFDESDAAGIVFFGNYFKFAHRALEHSLPEMGLDWGAWFDNPEYGVPLRHVEADYQKPLRPGQTFAAYLSVRRLGQSSVTFAILIKNQAGEDCAEVRTTHVFVQRKTRQKIDIPGNIRQALEKVPRSTP